MIATDGMGGVDPTGIMPGLCYGNCSDNLTNVGENNSSELVKTFPNPANDVVNIQSDFAISRVVVSDLGGRTLQSFDLANVYDFALDVKAMESGVYLLRVETEYRQIMRKIFVE